MRSVSPTQPLPEVRPYYPMQIARLGDECLACTGQAITISGAKVVALMDAPLELGSAVTVQFPDQNYVGEVTGCANLCDAFAISLILILRGTFL